MEVNRFPKFDHKGQRSQRLTTDTFVHIRETLEDFVSNCQYKGKIEKFAQKGSPTSYRTTQQSITSCQ